MQWSRNRALLAIWLFGAAATTGAVLWFWNSGELRSRDAARAAASEALARHSLDCHNDIEQSGDLVIEPKALAEVQARPGLSAPQAVPVKILPGETFESAQYDTLSAVCSALAQHYPIRHIAGHEHIAPERKKDPGPGFEWALLQRELGWPDSWFPAAGF